MSDPTEQWSGSESPMWGSGTGVLAFAPTYAQWGYYLRWNGTTHQMDDAGRFKFPSCPLGSKHLECAAPNITEPFDTYTAARPNAFWALGERTSLCAAPPRNWSACTINPHYGNGLIMKTADGTHRLTFFTSARAVQYSLSDFSPSQLLADYPFLTNNLTSIVGRDYGMVAQDPAAPQLVAAVFGTSVASERGRLALAHAFRRLLTCAVFHTDGAA